MNDFVIRLLRYEAPHLFAHKQLSPPASSYFHSFLPSFSLSPRNGGTPTHNIKCIEQPVGSSIYCSPPRVAAAYVLNGCVIRRKHVRANILLLLLIPICFVHGWNGPTFPSCNAALSFLPLLCLLGFPRSI